MSASVPPSVLRRTFALIAGLAVGALVWAVFTHFLTDQGRRSFGADLTRGVVFVLVVLALTAAAPRVTSWWKRQRSRS